jgi:hypothetical protein
VNRPTQLYVALLSALNVSLVAACLPHLEVTYPARFSAFLLFALLSSAFKVRIPGVEGIYSLNFIVMLAAVIELSLPELLILAIGCALTQSYWRAARHPQAIQVAFNMSNLAITISGTYTIVHSLPSWPDNWLFVSGGLAALGFYALNTGMTSIVLCLVEGSGLTKMWRHWNLYTLPYYLIGSTLSSAWAFCRLQFPWQGLVLVGLLLYFIFWAFRNSIFYRQSL